MEFLSSLSAMDKVLLSLAILCGVSIYYTLLSWSRETKQNIDNTLGQRGGNQKRET